jgi:hypothetical protein
MPDSSTRYRTLRRLGATLLALALACAIAAPLTASARTVEFTSVDRGGAKPIDLGLPDGSLGVDGKISFTTNRKDRQALKAAKLKENLLDKSEQYQAASTELANRIAAIRELLAAAEDDEEQLRAEIEARMVDRYKDGGAGDLEFLLSGESLGDVLEQGHILQDQSARDRRAAREYALTVDRIEDYETVLEELQDITSEQAVRLNDRAERLDDVLVAARVGHDEAPARTPKKQKTDGTWYIMDGAFQAQLFLPNAGSGYTGGTLTPARKASPAQIQAVLTDPRIDLDASGYQDVLSGQIDGRILDAMLLAARQFNYIKVTSLKSDHGVYTSSGNVSEHSYGCAMDIGTIGTTYISPSAQVPGGQVYQAVLFFNALGGDLAPHQVISLFDLGGATLAMGDHGDHIHVGYHC